MGLFTGIHKNKKTERVKKSGLMFLLEGDPIKVIDEIEGSRETERGGKTNNYTMRNGDMEIFMAALGTAEENENGTYAKELLRNVLGFVRGIHTPHTDIQRNLLYHLRQCRCILWIEYSFDSTGSQESVDKERAILAPILGIADKIDGIVAFGDERIFLDSRGRLIFDKGGNTELDFYMPAEIQPGADRTENIPAECQGRKARSMTWLKEKHIYVTPWLPFLTELEKDGPARTTREICGRAAALLAVSLYSESRLGDGKDYQQAKEFIASVVERFAAEEYFSPKERAYLNNPESTREEQISYSWQYENLWVMEWALGLIDELPYPDKICDVPLTVRVLYAFDSLDALEQGVSPRSYAELLDAADLIYRLDWACVDARLMEMPAPAGIDSGVVMERHRALFWLAGIDNRCDWDDVDLST